MICPYCDFDEEALVPSVSSGFNLFCTDCGEPFYRIEVMGNAHYFDESGRVDLPVSISNVGDKKMMLCGVKFYHEFSSGENPVQGKGIGKGANHEMIIPLKGINAPASYNLVFKLDIEKSLKEICPVKDVTLDVYPIPELTTPEMRYEVDPINGYDLVLPVTLENDSFVHITGVRVIRKISVIVEHKVDFVLTGEGDGGKLKIHLPPDELKAGEHPLMIQIEVQNLRKPYTLIDNLLIASYDTPDLKLDVRRFTEDGFVWEEVKQGLELNFPLENERKRKMRLSMVKQKEGAFFKDSCYISDFTEPPFIDLEGGLEEGEIFERIFNARISVTEEGAKGNLTITKIDKREETGHSQNVFPFKVNSFEQEEYDFFVGLDFGTVNSCIALSKPEKKLQEWIVNPIHSHVEILPVESEAYETPRIMPSVVGYDEEMSDFFVGSDIYMVTHKKEENRIRDIKLALKTTNEKPFPGMDMKKPQELTSLIIEELIRRGMGYLEEGRIAVSKTSRICIAVPTNYLPAWQEKIKDALEKALNRLFGEDVEVVSVYESMAAIRYYIDSNEDQMTHGIKIIYDFGGGTTDVTAILAYPLEQEGAVLTMYRVVGHSGDPSLGGRHLNEWIIDCIIKWTKSIVEKKVKEITVKLIKSGYWDETKQREVTESIFEVITNKKIDVASKRDTVLGLFDDVMDEILIGTIKERIDDEIYRTFAEFIYRIDDENHYDQIEGLKRNLGDPRRFEKFMFKELEGLTNEDMYNAIEPRLREEVRLIIEDVLNEIEMSRQESDFKHTDIEILLAGGSSSLFGFKDMINEIAEDVVKSDYKTIYEISQTTIIPEPKECVAKGAFLYGYQPARFDEINISPYDLMILIPKGVTVKDMDVIKGQQFKYLMRRRSKLPYEKTYKLSELGFFDDVEKVNLTIFAKYGTGEPEVYKRNLTIKNKGAKKTIKMTVDTMGEIGFEW